MITVVSLINILLIVGYYILNVSTETFIYPATAIQRRQGFIDNSLGSRLLDKELVGYFSNESIPFGAYKLAVNCFENCFFTYNIARAVTIRIVVKNVILMLVFIVCAFYGFKNSVIAVPIIQIFTSSLFLSELIHQLNFTSKLKGLFEKFKIYFTHNHNKSDLSMPIFLMLDYETMLAYNKAPLSDKQWNRLEESLSKEWEDIKKRYDIK
jgi:hypothetical protein